MCYYIITMEAEMRNLACFLCGLLLTGSTFALDVDISPYAGPVGPRNTGMDAQWDLLFSSEVGATVGDNQCLGGEFAGGKFYITGGNSAGEPNQVYVLNSNGTLDFQFDQWSSPGWGWRDLAYDGAYLYGSDAAVIEAFNLAGDTEPLWNISGPISPARALAYDPIEDHFWATSFSMPLYEFDRYGTIYNSGNHGLTGVYGLAWDNATDMLWFHDQTGGCVFHEFDPSNWTFTGLTYTLPLLPGSTSQVAGGLFYTEEWNMSAYCLGGVTQGTPEDQVFILEMEPIGGIYLDLVYESGSPIPASGGNLNFGVHIMNTDTVPQNFDAWLAVEWEGGAPTTLVMRYFTNFLPGWAINRPDMYYPVPGSYAPGYYVFFLPVGDEPTQNIWMEDNFPFLKLGSYDGSAFLPYSVDGAPNPFDEVVEGGGEQGDARVAPTEYALLEAYPNPFNPETVISYQLSAVSLVNLAVYDIQGRQVADLVNGWRDAGVHEVAFDGSSLASGVYIYRLEMSGSGTTPTMETGKMLLLK